jgi:hypothetical protein
VEDKAEESIGRDGVIYSSASRSPSIWIILPSRCLAAPSYSLFTI